MYIGTQLRPSGLRRKLIDVYRHTATTFRIEEEGASCFKDDCTSSAHLILFIFAELCS
jgi:hypothetical protein